MRATAPRSFTDMIDNEFTKLRSEGCLFDGTKPQSKMSWNECFKCWYLKESAKVSHGERVPQRAGVTVWPKAGNSSFISGQFGSGGGSGGDGDGGSGGGSSSVAGGDVGRVLIIVDWQFGGGAAWGWWWIWRLWWALRLVLMGLTSGGNGDLGAAGGFSEWRWVFAVVVVW